MSKNYTILFTPIEAVGCINPAIGIAEQLHERGHNIVFATTVESKEKVIALGFKHELVTPPPPTIDTAKGSEDVNYWRDFINSISSAMPLASIEHLRNIYLPMYLEMLKELKTVHGQFKDIVDRVKPDVIIVDRFVHIPAIMNRDIPWILSSSMNPLGTSNVSVPPAWSGYPTDGNPKDWQPYKNEIHQTFHGFLQELKAYLKDATDLDTSKMVFPYFVEYSPWANIYTYPAELDYASLRPKLQNWHQFDGFVRKTVQSFELPQQLTQGQGKLIYFTMGTIGSADVDMMKRLTAILSKSPHRFIVSKGPRANEYELPDNMWGESYVPQTKVIPLVDLVINHGGNNSITESFYFGKRVLVMPMLWDQSDNAQRVYETGLGLQCRPYTVTEEELLGKIEFLLADELYERRMVAISKRMQSTNSQAAAADLVERIAANNRPCS